MGSLIITVQMSANASIGPTTVFRSGVALQAYEPLSVD